jgi:hypothetical protein
MFPMRVVNFTWAWRGQLQNIVLKFHAMFPMATSEIKEVASVQ